MIQDNQKYVIAYSGYQIQIIQNAWFENFVIKKKQYLRGETTCCCITSSSGGTSATSGAFITNDQGMVDPNAQVYVNSHSSPNSASSSTSVDSRSGFGGSKSSVSVFPSANQNNAKR